MVSDSAPAAGGAKPSSLPALKTVMPELAGFQDRWHAQHQALAIFCDLFKALRHHNASIVTDHIKHFEANGIELESGEFLEADIVVSATGLNVFLFGGMELSVDSETVDLAQSVAYKAMMLSAIPNFAFAIGYTNASWTLKVDLVCEHVCRLLTHMDETGTDTFMPVQNGPLELRPLMDFQAGYVQRAVALFPKQATAEPWTVSMSYATDRKRLIEGPVTDPALRFSKSRVPEALAASTSR